MHINFLLGAQNVVFWVGAKKFIMRTGVSTKMSMEMPTKVDILCVRMLFRISIKTPTRVVTANLTVITKVCMNVFLVVVYMLTFHTSCFLPTQFRADLGEGDATNHFSVKERFFFSVKRGRQFSE